MHERPASYVATEAVRRSLGSVPVSTVQLVLHSGTVPSTFKFAYITPLLKKADLDPADAKSYRPISNLSVISKLLERLVSKQLLMYLKNNGLLPDLQSAYRGHRSTETAVLKVLSDILSALDTGNIAMLTLLDLSAAFDIVDHNTLLLLLLLLPQMSWIRVLPIT